MLELFHALDELQESIKDVPDHVSIVHIGTLSVAHWGNQGTQFLHMWHH